MPRYIACALAGAAVVLTVCVAAPAAAQVPDLEQAQTLIAEGRPLEAFQLLEPFEAQYAGDVTFDYLLARSALDSGNPSRASFIYERILAVEPNYVGVRLESGRAYLELENYARAKQEFDLVLRVDNLPPDLRQAAEQYVRIVEERLHPKRTFVSFFGEYGFGFDDNVNSGTDEQFVALPDGTLVDFGTEKRDSFYHALAGGGQVIHRLTENWSVFAGADYLGRLHALESNFDTHDVNARGGVGYATGPDNVRVFARYGRFFFNDDAIRDVLGYTLDWLHAVDDRNQVNGTFQFTRHRFDDPIFASNDFDAYEIAASWNHSFAEGKALLVVRANVGTENAVGGRLDGDNTTGGLTLTVQRTLTDSLGAFASAGVQRINYEDLNAVFLRTRLDTTYSLAGGVSWGFATGWSLRPQVSYTSNKSNIPTSEYDRLDVSLNLRKDF